MSSIIFKLTYDTKFAPLCISPYCKGISAVSSVKLVNLFQLFTSTKFLYAAEGNHIYVSLLLETFNNIIQYQYEGNANIVYAVVKRKELVCFVQFSFYPRLQFSIYVKIKLFSTPSYRILHFPRRLSTPKISQMV